MAKSILHISLSIRQHARMVSGNQSQYVSYLFGPEHHGALNVPNGPKRRSNYANELLIRRVCRQAVR